MLTFDVELETLDDVCEGCALLYFVRVRRTFLFPRRLPVASTLAAPPSISALNVTAWTVNQSGFSGTMTISSGFAPYTLTAQAGLPTGLSLLLSGSTISFTGTPSTVGTFSSGNVTIRDASLVSASRSFTITINAAPSLGALSTSAWTGEPVRVQRHACDYRRNGPF